MISTPSEARIWIAMGHTDMRAGMSGLALKVQERFKKDAHAGDIYVFSEPPRDHRRPFGLSYAAMGMSSSMA